ncbi:hypothetical protein ACBQ21_27995, partial [Pseudomonas putida]|uniref:hypothetical protein n=1 Tax=Pseudomonas putida TaxID=303 RepID=UPI003523512F
ERMVGVHWSNALDLEALESAIGVDGSRAVVIGRRSAASSLNVERLQQRACPPLDAIQIAT